MVVLWIIPFLPYGGTLDLNVLGVSLLYFLVFVIYYLLTMKKRQKWIDKNVILNAFFIFYILMVLYFVWLPIEIIIPDDRIQIIMHTLNREYLTTSEIANMNLVPFRSLVATLNAPLFLWRFTLRAVVGNFVLLLPVPILLGLRSKKELTFKKVVLIGFLTTFFIESSQLVINFLTGWPNRLVCVDDLLLNTLGVVVGYFIFKRYRSFFEKTISRIHDFLSS